MIIAKYKINKSIYANLLPIFNEGYTGYTITDEDHTLITEQDMITGYISLPTGLENPEELTNYPDAMMSDFFNVTPNTVYGISYIHVIWYDANKNRISHLEWEETAPGVVISPENAAYVRICRRLAKIKDAYFGYVIRTIEHNTLPTKMMFGYDTVYGDTRHKALLEMIDIDITNITDMDKMFYKCINLMRIDVSNWDVGNVTSLQSTFRDCSELRTLDVSNWDVGNVEIFGSAFRGCVNLSSLDVSNWDTSNATDIGGIVADCRNLKNIDMSNWNVSKVITLSLTFSNCTSLTSLDISNWDVRKVINMNDTFHGCASLTSLDLNKWNTKSLTNMNSMFKNCSNLASLKISNFRVDKVTNMNSSFQNCFNLTELNVSRWDVRKVRYADTVFGACRKLTKLDLSNWNLASCGETAFMISQCWELTELDLSNINIKNVTYMDYMLQDDSKLKTLNLNNMRFVGNLSSILSASNNIEKIYMNNVDDITKMVTYFPNRVSKDTPGYLVTTLRDKLSADVVKTLATKNWFIKDLVAQYKFDANTCENYMPEFNEEFNEDEYEIIDTVSEIVIEPSDIKWNVHSINQNRYSNIFPIVPNVQLKKELAGVTIDWYDENGWLYTTLDSEPQSQRISPTKAILMELVQGPANYNDVKLTAKIVTRSIESKNGNLPTLMRFGYGGKDTENHAYDGPGMSLLKVYDLNTKNLTNCYRMFKYCKRVTEINSKNWNVSNVANMFAMFAHCNKLISLDVSNWDVSNVTDMNCTFWQCQSLTSIDVSNWDVSNVTDMFDLFYNCSSLTSLDVSKWDTSNVINMQGMFYTCRLLTSLDVSNLDTTNVTNMHNMFANCINLTSLDVSKWDVSKVTDMQSMFSDCNNLTSLDVSNWDTSNATAMNNMFHNCTALTTLDVSNWDVSNVTDMNYMFRHCQSLTSLDLSNWDVSNVVHLHNMFNYCQNLTTVGNLSNWNTSKVIDTYSMFSNCYKLTSLDLTNWDVSKVQNMVAMFSLCQSLTTVGDLSNWDTRNVATMGSMFMNCESLLEVDVSNWDVSKVHHFDNMFNDCVSLTKLDVYNWDVSNANNMHAMFSDCVNLNKLDLTNWNPSKVESLSYFFDGKIKGGSNIKVFDISQLDFSGLTEIAGMFYKNNKVNIIRMPKIIGPINSVEYEYADNPTESCGTFHCRELVTLDFGGLDISNVTDDKSKLLEYVPNLRYIRTNNANLIADLAQYFPERTEAEQGYLITKAEVSDDIRSVLSTKYWNVVDLDEVGVDIAVYKFNTEYYKNNIPLFDNEFVDYFIDDVIEDESTPHIITRTIRSLGGAPKKATFGREDDDSIGTTYCSRSLEHLLYLNTTQLNNMRCMFNHCNRVKTINSTDWDTSKVTNFYCVLRYCALLTSIDVSNWDTSNVTHMYCAFGGCSSLTSLDVSNWDVSKVNNMEYLFSVCSSLTTVGDLSNWDTGNAIGMSCMFNECNSLTSIGDISNWNTSKATNMSYLFRGCVKFTSLDVSNWDVSKVTSMEHMFYKCRSLTSLDLSNWDTSKLTNMRCMFYGCNALTSLDLSNWNTSKVTDVGCMFESCNSLTSIGVSNWDTSKVINMGSMFRECNNLTSLDVSNWDVGKVTNMRELFYNCKKITTLDVSKWDTSSVNDMGDIFNGCLKLKTIDVSNWDVSNVGVFGGLFNTCQSLTSIDVSNWDTSNGWSMQFMFNNCISLQSLDLSNFVTNKVSHFSRMLSNCVALTSLDISNFDIAHKEENEIIDMINIGNNANIGMIYCDYKTINRVAALLPTNKNVTIWVGKDVNIDILSKYDHVVYRTYDVKPVLDVELSNALLQGDTLEIIDGDLYHCHRMIDMVIDSSYVWNYGYTEHGWGQGDYMSFYTYGNQGGNYYLLKPLKPNGKIYCNDIIAIPGNKNDYNTNLEHIQGLRSSGSYLTIRIYKDRILSADEYVGVDPDDAALNVYRQGITNWFAKNPLRIIHELNKPQYELIKENVGLLNVEQGVYLTITDSIIPVITKQDLCTMKLNYLYPETEYRVSFKANKTGDVTIDLGGVLSSIEIVEGMNNIVISTGNVVEHEYLKIHGKTDIKIQNVMVNDSDKELKYFRGVDNTFDELSVKNIIPRNNLLYTHVENGNGKFATSITKAILRSKCVTILGKVVSNPKNLPIGLNLYRYDSGATGKNLLNLSYTEDNPRLNNGHTTQMYQAMFSFQVTEGQEYTLSFNYDNTLSSETSNALFIDVKYDDNGIWNASDGGSLFKYLSSHYNGVGFFERTFTATKNGTVYVFGALNAGVYYWNFQLELGNQFTGYEEYRDHVNNEFAYINPDESGRFILKLSADRKYANMVGMTIGNLSACEVGDRIQIDEIMILEGDVTDCYPTKYKPSTDAYYIAEFKSYNNQYGFGKNKMI